MLHGTSLVLHVLRVSISFERGTTLFRLGDYSGLLGDWLKVVHPSISLLYKTLQLIVH